MCECSKTPCCQIGPVKAEDVWQDSAGNQFRVIGLTSQGFAVIEYNKSSNGLQVGITQTVRIESCHFNKKITPKKVGYVNLYNDGVLLHETRKAADRCASGSSRLACIRVEYSGGQFDD